jgi:segregation and condensation protein A
LANSPSLASLNKVVNMTRITIREKIYRILDILKTDATHSFRDILASQNRVEIVVTFLALLELIKRHIVEASQEELFGDIQFRSLGEWQEEELAELEFDE